MKVAIIGTGYVGLPTGVGLAELGHQVICIDNDESKIAKLQQSQLTIYEHGLQELFDKHVSLGHLTFTTNMKEGLSGAQLIIIAVGTPPHPITNEADLSYLYEAAAQIAPCLNSSYTVVATKSTVPVGTGDEVESIINHINPQANCDVISLPEFLREGYAIYDFFHPDRIVVGSDSTQAKKLIASLYEPLLALHPHCQMLYVSRRSSETIKYAANSLLATKIHFINEMADFCEQSGADIYEVASGIGLDQRIGKSFLNPGPGFGGSCFPKDTMALDLMAQKYGVNLSLVHATLEGNKQRITSMAQRIVQVAKQLNDGPAEAKARTAAGAGAGTVAAAVGAWDGTGAVVGILGLAFKNGTDDCRFSPAMQIVDHILKVAPNITLRVFDPKAMDNAKKILSGYSKQIVYVNSAQEVSHGADILVVLTEWGEFSNLDLNYCALHMRHKVILDYRNKLSMRLAHELGFSYSGVGLGTDDLHH